MCQVLDVASFVRKSVAFPICAKREKYARLKLSQQHILAEKQGFNWCSQSTANMQSDNQTHELISADLFSRHILVYFVWWSILTFDSLFIPRRSLNCTKERNAMKCLLMYLP